MAAVTIKDVWKPLEARWDAVLRTTFNIQPSAKWKLLIEQQEKRVKALDILMLGREMIDLMPFGQEDQAHLGYLDDRRPSDIAPIEAWSPTRSRAEFLARFKRLF